MARSAPRPALVLIALLGLLLANCARIAEPPQDPGLIAATERLASDTVAAFDALDPAPAAAAERAATYAALAEAARALRLRTLTRLQLATGEGPYANATAGFMADYLRLLDRLAAEDAAAAAAGRALAPQLVALRRAGLEDALRDALFFERQALDRSR